MRLHDFKVGQRAYLTPKSKKMLGWIIMCVMWLRMLQRFYLSTGAISSANALFCRGKINDSPASEEIGKRQLNDVITGISTSGDEHA